MRPRFLLVVSEADPVAPAVAEAWGTPPSTGAFVDGVPVRELAPGIFLLRRSTRHIHDERLDARLPSLLTEPARVPIVFPSVHRSESGTPCFTVHPIGNFGPTASVGGRPRTLVPTAPRLMVDALRRLHEEGRSIGLPATYEATHHGPELECPAFFAEIGFGDAAGPSAEAVRALATVLPSLVEDPEDRPVVGVGGGHYGPHFTELALERRWAFGHIVSRHSLSAATRAEVESAVRATPDAAGILFARTADADDPRASGVAPRCRDLDAPPRSTGEPRDPD